MQGAGRGSRLSARKLATACGAGTALGLALAAPPACARHAGPTYTWVASVQGPLLSGRGIRVLSPALQPGVLSAQADRVVSAVRWYYTFNGVVPRDLQAYLCNASRCVMLQDAQGQTEAFRGDAAEQGFIFAFLVPGRGALAPVLQGRTNQVIVTYR